VARTQTGSAIDGRTTRHAGDQSPRKVHKHNEDTFGWLKTLGGWRKTRLISQTKLASHALLYFVAYNVVRIGSLSGGWNA